MAPVRSRSDSGFPAPEISWPVKPDNANPFPKAVAAPYQQMPRRTNRRPAREPGPRSQDLWHLSDGPVRKVDNLGLPTETRKQVKGPKDMTTMPGHHAVNHRGEIIMEMPKRTPVGNGTSCAPIGSWAHHNSHRTYLLPCDAQTSPLPHGKASRPAQDAPPPSVARALLGGLTGKLTAIPAASSS